MNHKASHEEKCIRIAQENKNSVVVNIPRSYCEQQGITPGTPIVMKPVLDGGLLIKKLEVQE